MSSISEHPSAFKTFKYEATLDYCDGPLIIQLTDTIGGNYLGIVRDHDDAFVVVGTPPELIHKFRCGIVDLKAVILGSETDPWYLASITDDQQTVQASPQFGKSIKHEITPEEGSFLHYHSVSASDEISKLARDRGTTLIQLSLDSLDIHRLNRLSTDMFRKLLLRVQTLLDSAYSGFVNLDVVVPARQGSFQVLLDASSSYQDSLVGHTDFITGLEVVDSLFSFAEDDDSSEFEKFIEEHSDKQGLIKAYYDLLLFLNNGKVSFAYGWFEHTGRSNNTSLSLRQTQNLVASVSTLVKHRVDRVIKEIEITGVLVSCNVQKGSWGLITETNSSISGRVRQAKRLTLNGLVIGKRYMFLCEQQSSISTFLSNQSPNVYLVEYTELS